MTPSLIPVRIISEVNAQDLGYVGSDLKRIAQCDDGHTYAAKRLEDHPLIPISEWVGHHLCRRCGIRTPDFEILVSKTNTPRFGSRIASYQQIEESPGSFRVQSFFSGQQAALSAIYTLDAILTNRDRHGRNMFLRTDAAKQTTLLAFDFSQAWVRVGQPFGNEEAMRDSHTQKWWKTFKRIGCKVDGDTLSLMQTLDADWLRDVLQAAPPQWVHGMDVQATLDYWTTRSTARIRWATLWLT